jgi:predicted nucleotidyltransferase
MELEELNRIVDSILSKETFPVIEPCRQRPDLPVLRKVHPLKQHMVSQLIDCAKENPSVARIHVFGSAITHHCGIDSDIDLYIQFLPHTSDAEKNAFRREILAFLGVADIFYDTDIDAKEAIYNEIMKGLVVYEKQSA